MLLNIFLPFAMFVMMTIIGTGLAWQDFMPVAARPVLLVLVSACQLCLLPLLMYLLVLGVDPPVTVAASMFIMAAGPGGGLSNILTAHARGNVALSIGLTTVGSLLSLVTVPLVLLLLLPRLLEFSTVVTMPYGQMLAQLIFFMVLPVSLGIFLRNRYPVLISTHQLSLHRCNSLLLLFVIVYSFALDEGISWQAIFSALPYAVIFLMVSAILAFSVSILFRLPQAERKTLLLEFSVQSAAIATLLIAVVLKQFSWLPFVGAAACLQMLIALCIVMYKYFRGSA